MTRNATSLLSVLVLAATAALTGCVDAEPTDLDQELLDEMEAAEPAGSADLDRIGDMVTPHLADPIDFDHDDEEDDERVWQGTWKLHLATRVRCASPDGEWTATRAGTFLLDIEGPDHDLVATVEGGGQMAGFGDHDFLVFERAAPVAEAGGLDVDLDVELSMDLRMESLRVRSASRAFGVLEGSLTVDESGCEIERSLWTLSRR